MQRAFELGPITSFVRHGQEVHVRARSLKGRAALDAYFAEKDACLAAQWRAKQRAKQSQSEGGAVYGASSEDEGSSNNSVDQGSDAGDLDAAGDYPEGEDSDVEGAWEDEASDMSGAEDYADPHCGGDP